MSDGIDADDLPEEVTIAMRVEDMPNALFDNSKGECDGCGAEVWLSQGTQIEIERGVYPDAIYCVHCIPDDESER